MFSHRMSAIKCHAIRVSRLSPNTTAVESEAVSRRYGTAAKEEAQATAPTGRSEILQPYKWQLDWQPNKRLRELGFRNAACGPDGPEARAIAEEWNREATASRLSADTARAVMDAGTQSAMYTMLWDWSIGCSVRTASLKSLNLKLRTIDHRSAFKLDQHHGGANG
jgi:hypothetical protein